MGQPAVHFVIIRTNPAKLLGYYGELFGWEFDTSSPVAHTVSEPRNYGFVYRIRAERLGGQRQMGPERAPAGPVVGHFTDPEGNLIGVAGPA